MRGEDFDRCYEQVRNWAFGLYEDTPRANFDAQHWWYPRQMVTDAFYKLRNERPDDGPAFLCIYRDGLTQVWRMRRTYLEVERSVQSELRHIHSRTQTVLRDLDHAIRSPAIHISHEEIRRASMLLGSIDNVEIALNRVAVRA